MNENMKKLMQILHINPEMMAYNRMTTDEILDCCGCTVDEDGEILDENGNVTGIWYEEVEY